MFSKILVIGCPGSGKSTFARALHKATGIPLYHLDRIWYRQDGSTVTRDEFDRRLSEILKKDSWIIDGHYRRTLETRLRACDTVFFLDYPTELCLEGARSRVGTPHDDLPWLETGLDPELELVIKAFRTEKRPEVLELFGRYPDKTAITVKSRREAEEYLIGAAR